MRISSRPAALALAALLLSGCGGRAAPPEPIAPATLVDDVPAAREALERARDRAREARDGSPADRVRRLTALGLWDEAEALLARQTRTTPSLLAAAAELHLRRHRYPEAAAAVEAALAADRGHRGARLLRARLQVQAWELPAAAATVQALLEEQPRDEAAALLLGRIRLLEKQYDRALALAQQVQQWNPRSAGAHLLEADVRFWNQDPTGAETPLIRALMLDPFDPDARFAYGYALWRRVDATLLDDMAGQWELALEVDPLHYVTHWHWGNGHTNLTYADYAEPSDSTVRAELAAADSLVAIGRPHQAIELAREVERRHAGSVLPALFRGSAYYMAWDMERGARLDSAEAAFREALRRKPHYGPAHNALAAVIKQRQFAVLARYDSLEAEIARAPEAPAPGLAAVFPDVRYYPGGRVERMVRHELGPSAAYLPLIQRQGREYRIPPLHRDLAAAMGQTYFRTATTFDNRQWMDIRGVGSGAAGIEYVERGAHQERKVLLHEFVHLFHSIVLTDQEVRRVRQLYHDAMREGRTLDYYASNNEHEFLAQAFPAFLSPVKVHPLNHKSMNTHDDLLRRDPATYAFVDSLIARQRAFLAGDSLALRSNWAQVYVNLSERARDERGGAPDARFARAAALLDSALVWDAAYQPAMLSYAALLRDRGQFEGAERWLATAEYLDPAYAPVFRARAELLGARARAEGGEAAALDEQAALYRRALELETDLAVRAELSRSLWELYREHGRLAQAVEVAEQYAADAPEVSTYLRDRRDEAAAFAHGQRAAAGYAQETLDFFARLVAQKPQNYGLRSEYAAALASAGRPDEAVATLEEAQRILRAAGNIDTRMAARVAEIRLLQGDSRAARAALEPVLAGDPSRIPPDLRLARVLQSLGLTTEAHRQLAQQPEPRTPADRAELAFTRGWIHRWRGDDAEAERLWRAALADDPYHRPARLQLVRLLRDAGRDAEAQALLAAAAALPLPLGPDFQREVDDAQGTSSATPRP